ncbi:hypothetical protein K435DRAFT_970781 [Dendrothele bispora CBS 962.96]|uniref:Uncharacterized protein n=1 Tax=Dendrothele bispora (strain CBS 962.96) TaxID=1314807 RepID=A0A4S8L9Q9_DENBC|nr:hypothetical protein K435DRAFT_970781 [Dendrothele bispora CBS 962.96]
MTAVLVQFKLRTKSASPTSIKITAKSVELVQPNEGTSRLTLLRFWSSASTQSLILCSARRRHRESRAAPLPSLYTLIYVCGAGCSDSVYKVIREQERDTYKSLLRKTAFLADHPRQDPQTIQEVRQQRPFVSEDKASHHWNDIYDDLQLPKDGATDLDTTAYSIGAVAEVTLHPEEEGEENGMDEEVEGEERMDEENDGREDRMGEEEGGEQGMDETEP